MHSLGPAKQQTSDQWATVTVMVVYCLCRGSNRGDAQLRTLVYTGSVSAGASSSCRYWLEEASRFGLLQRLREAAHGSSLNQTAAGGERQALMGQCVRAYRYYVHPGSSDPSWVVRRNTLKQGRLGSLKVELDDLVLTLLLYPSPQEGPIPSLDKAEVLDVGRSAWISEPIRYPPRPRRQPSCLFGDGNLPTPAHSSNQRQLRAYLSTASIFRLELVF
jgi:hypothetical protein